MLAYLEFTCLVLAFMLTVLSYFYNKKFNYSYLDKSIANYSIIVLALQLVVFLGFKYFNLKYQIYYLLPFNVFYITAFYKVLIKSSAQKSTKDILAHILIGILLICYVLQFSLAKTTFVEVYYIFYQIVLLVLLIKCLVKYLAVTKFETNPHVSAKWFFHSLVVLTVIEATLFFYNLISGLDLNDIQITSILYSSFVCTILLIFVIKAITGSETELQNIDKIVKPVVNSKESHIDDILLDMLLTTKDDKYQKSKLKIEDIEVIKSKFLRIKEEELYLDPELNLDELSNLLKIPKHTISQAFNTIYNTNFKEYLNYLRCEYALKFILKEDSNQNIVEIAYQSGFNSKTSFYRAFKKVYNCSPIEYKQRILN